MNVQIRAMVPADRAQWLRMRLALWPDEREGHEDDIRGYFAGDRHEPQHVLVAVDPSGAAIGFAELSIRNIVDGCFSDRVAYLEGWYVDPEARRYWRRARAHRRSRAVGRSRRLSRVRVGRTHRQPRQSRGASRTRLRRGRSRRDVPQRLAAPTHHVHHDRSFGLSGRLGNARTPRRRRSEKRVERCGPPLYRQGGC